MLNIIQTKRNTDIKILYGMQESKIKTLHLGFSLTEVLVGASIISVALIAILNAYGYLIRAEIGSVNSLKATYLLEEGIEASHYLRDKGWASNIASLGTTTKYYLYLSSSGGVGVWQATTTKQIYGGIFERTMTLSDVYRSSATQDISPTGILDPNTIKIKISVSWPGISGATTTKQLSIYLTNMNKN